MHKTENCKDRKIAWTKKDWIYVGKSIPDVNTKKIKETLSSFIGAVNPKITEPLHVDSTGIAYWNTISDKDLKIVQTAQIVWGLKKEKIQWDRETETIVLRTALRLWKYKSNSYILDFMTDMAKKRRSWLIKELKSIKNNKVLEKLNKTGLDYNNLESSIANLKLNQAESAVIKRAIPIIKELQWKNNQTAIIKKWLAKNSHIPEQAGKYWLDAWTTDNSLLVA